MPVAETQASRVLTVDVMPESGNATQVHQVAADAGPELVPVTMKRI
jgi:hypothetical protein